VPFTREFVGSRVVLQSPLPGFDSRRRLDCPRSAVICCPEVVDSNGATPLRHAGATRESRPSRARCSEGDGFLARFGCSADVVCCGIEIQWRLVDQREDAKTNGRDAGEDRRMLGWSGEFYLLAELVSQAPIPPEDWRMTSMRKRGCLIQVNGRLSAACEIPDSPGGPTNSRSVALALESHVHGQLDNQASAVGGLEGHWRTLAHCREFLCPCMPVANNVVVPALLFLALEQTDLSPIAVDVHSDEHDRGPSLLSSCDLGPQEDPEKVFLVKLVQEHGSSE
jgi:hypothetical protein